MKILFTLLVIISIISCEKKIDSKDIIINQDSLINDYRDSYIGLFNFKTIYNITSMCAGDTISICENGWKKWGYDTLYFNYSIIKVDSNMLSIKFVEKELKTYNDSVIITSEGKILSPTFPNWGHYSFEGRFIGSDSVEIKINIGGLIGGYETYKTIGVREK